MAARTILVNASFAPSLIGFRGPLLRRMVACGHNVHASAPDLTGEMAARVRSLGVTPHDVVMSRTGQNPFSDLAYRQALRRLIHRESIDLVLGYTIKPCIWGSLAASSEGVESVSLITGLGYAFTGRGGLKTRVTRAVAVRLWRLATAANRRVVFQNSDDLADFAAAGALGDVSKAGLVAGSGVDLGEFPRQPLPPTARFLMVSRLLGNKGVREYAEAAVRLLRSGVDASFALAGYFDEGPDGIDREELSRWRASGLDYLGPLEDVRPALAHCSIFVLPSYREGTPRSVLEAMATGRPIITSDAPGCRQTVADGESGLLVRPRDIGALAEAMQRLASDAALRSRMAEASWRRAKAIYDIDRVNDAMMVHLGLADQA